MKKRRFSYSLRKCETVLKHVYHQFKKRKKRLSLPVQEEIREALMELQEEILKKNRESADQLARHVERLSKTYLKKGAFDQARDFTFAIVFALVVAVLIRQIWFEFYEIPSGSMRPTLKEQDRLIVSKTNFGINLPLTTDHLYFDSALMKRSGIIVFTGENMDIRDVDTLYFYLFPGKKQYVKRLMGKPGDTLYFYGGKIFGIDKNENDISRELDLPFLDKIEHIPFLTFEGKVSTPQSPMNGIYSPVIIHQMNEPIAKLWMVGPNEARGEMLVKNGSKSSFDFCDLWGMKNFAMTRLLTAQQVRQLTDFSPEEIGEGVLYLEIKHHPSLSSLKIGRDEYMRPRPLLGSSSSLLPLSEAHLRSLFANLYTARFVVKNGFVMRQGMSKPESTKDPFLPHLPGIPDGCYEFYYGKAYRIRWQGIAEELPQSHPLYRFDPIRLQLLYNVGMEFDMRFAPQTKNQRLLPARYGYFRAGDLYLLGAPILKKEDPNLIAFLEKEEKRRVASSPVQPYLPFKDNGAPLKEDGTLNIPFIKQYGLQIPDQMVLGLGDNHAMSADSRDFGFVPQNNLRGSPLFIFWPPGSRWGLPNQPAYAFFNVPCTLVWLVVALVCGLWYSWHRKHNRLPLKF